MKSTMDTSASLLERLRSPEPQAWQRFVELYTPLLFSFARRLGFGNADAADLVQDVFLALIQELPRFQYDGGKSFRAWLWTLMRNRAASLRRARVAQAGPLPEIETADAVDEICESEYRQALVGRALEIMRRDFEPATWKACWIHVVSGRTAQEVATEFGTTPGAVYAAKFRVLARLRHELQDLLD